MVSNCYIWAKWQHWKYGGYFTRVKSQFGWWNHYTWSPDLITFHEFVPVWSKHLWRKKYPPILFRGKVHTFVPRERRRKI